MRALFCILLAAAPDAVELRYRFARDTAYVETTTRSFRLEGEREGKKVLFDVSSEETLERTVLETDETEHPTRERVKVVKFARDVKSSPDEKTGARSDACEGGTFEWRRLEERWGLFDGDLEVTAKHARLVDRLKNWRDARLPRGAVAVGATWEVDAVRFLETAGQPVPPGVTGEAVFRLEGIEGDIASIRFTFEAKARIEGVEQTWRQKGTFRFDAKKGRELEFTADGTVSIDGGGQGTVKSRRVVDYR